MKLGELAVNSVIQKLREKIEQFRNDNFAAVTVDWVVLTALVIFGVGVLVVLTQGHWDTLILKINNNV